MLYVDGQPVVVNDFSQGFTARNGSITLGAGPHSLIIKYANGATGAGMLASYNGPDTGGVVPIGTIPGSVTNNGLTTFGASSIDNNITLAPGVRSGIELAGTAATSTGSITLGANSTLLLTGESGGESLTQVGALSINGRGTLMTGLPQVLNGVQDAGAGADLIVNNPIVDAGVNSTLIKDGPRTLRYGANDIWTGKTTILGGNLDTAGFNTSLTSLNVVNMTNIPFGNTETISTGAGTLTLNSDVNLSGSSAGAITFSGNLNLGGGSRTINANAATASVISAVLSNGNLVKTGFGGLVLSANNSAYTGQITVNSGRLAITNANALGTTGVNTVVNPGGFLDIVNVAPAEPLVLNGNGLPVPFPGTNNYGGPQYSGALQGSGGFGSVVSGPVTLGSNASIGVAAGNMLTISGVIGDGGGGFTLSKTQGSNTVPIATSSTSGGPGILRLTGANTYTGATVIRGGELQLGAATGVKVLQSTNIVIGDGGQDAALTMLTGNDQFAAGTILTFNGGDKNAKFQLNGTTQTIAGFGTTFGRLPFIQNHENGAAATPGTLIINNPSDTRFNGEIRDQNGVLNITKQGAGTFTLSGDGARGTGIGTYTGTTTVGGGKFLLSNSTTFNSPVVITAGSGGSFEVYEGFNRTVTYAKTITDNGAGFTKSGLGTMAVTSTGSTVTGTINVNGGVLSLQGGTNNFIGAPINVAAGASLQFNGLAGPAAPVTYNNNVTLNGLSPGGALAGAVIGGTPDNTLTGTLTLNATSNISTGWADKTFRITGQITGPGGLQFDKMLFTQQPPVFQITNTANNWAGGTTINAGTVYFTQGALPSTGLLTFGGFQTQSSLGGTFTGPNIVLGTNGLSSFSRSIGTGDGQVRFTGEGGGFSAVGAAQSITFGGVGTPQSVDWGAAGFDAGATLWLNDSLALASGSVKNANAEMEITNDIAFSGGGIRRVFVDNAQARLSGALSGPGGLFKDGNNNLVLSGATSNTYTGLTNVSGGTLILSKTGGAIALAGDVQISNNQGGTRRIVQLGGNEQIADTAVVSFVGSNANNGDLRLFGFSETVAGISDRSGGGVIELVDASQSSTSSLSTLTINGSGDSFYNGFLRNVGGTPTVGGTLALTKAGAGTLTLSAGQQSGTGNVNYTGATTVNGGRLVLANLTGFASTTTLASGTTLELLENFNNTATFAPVITGAGDVVKTGLGTTILSGTNTYSGTTTVAAGTLTISGAPTGVGSYVVNPGANLQIGNGGATGAIPDAANISTNGTVVFARNNAYTYSGVISGTGGVSATTAGGAIVLSGANTYTGVTTVSGGTLTLAGSGISAGGLVLNSGGTLVLDFAQANSNPAGIVAAAAPVTFNGGTLNVVGNGGSVQTLGPVTVNPGVSTLNPSGGLSLTTGAFTRKAGGVLNVSLPGGATAVSTTGTGVGGILGGWAVTTGANPTFVAIDGLGNLTPLTTFTNDNWTGGNVAVTADSSQGPSAVANSVRFDAATAANIFLDGATTSKITSGGIIVTPNVGANGVGIFGGNLAGASPVGGGDLTIHQLNTAGTLTIGAVIVDNGGPTAMTKSGAGSLILTAENTYSGGTFIQGGLVRGSVGTGPVVVGAAGTLQLGDGIIINNAMPAVVTNAGNVVVNNFSDQTISTAFNASQNFNFTNNAINNPTSFQTGVFTKTGPGTLTIVAPLLSNQFHQRQGTTVLDTGANVVSNGFNSVGLLSGDVATLTVQGVGRITQSGDFNVGDVSANGTLNIQGAGAVIAGNLFVGKFGTAVGVVNQTLGSVSNSGGNNDWRIGGGGTSANPNAYGIYNLSAGTFQTGRNFQIGADGRGVFNQTGGSVSVTGGFPVVGRYAGSNGLLNVSGGTFSDTSTTKLIIGESGSGVLNVSGTGQVLLTNAAAGSGLTLGGNTAGAGAGPGTGIVNLLPGGLIQTTLVADQNALPADGTSIFNFNGGTLRVANGTTNATFMQGLTAAYVQAGGANIDTNSVNVTIGQQLIAPSGNGLLSIDPGSGGSGYVGEPIVQITGGGGTGATARAVLTGGTVTGFVITNPGSGYTSAPTVNLLGGGGTGASAGTATISPVNASGGLNKLNAGTLTLNSTASYGGSTTITGGVLALDYSATSAPVSNMLPVSSNLVINGGGLLVTGKGATVNLQAFNGVTLNGTGTITGTSGTSGTVNIALGAITRNTDSAVDFTLPATGSITTTTANTGTNILGGWATVGGANWAVSAGDGTNPGAITALGTYVNNTWAVGNNTTSTANTTVPAGSTTNSLRFATAAATTVTLSGTNTIATGGILEAAAVGNFASTITGGSLTSGASGGDIFVNQSNTANTLTIVSTLAQSGALIKNGGGVLILNAAANTHTYAGDTVVGAGTLRIGTANQIPDGSGRGNLVVHAGGSFDLNGLAETVGGLTGYGTVTTGTGTGTLTVGNNDTSTTFSGLITNGSGTTVLNKVGVGTLTFNNVAAHAYTGATTITAGSINIATPAALSNNTTINVNVANGLVFDTTIPVISGLAGNGPFSLQTQAGAPVQLSVGNNNATATYSGSLTGPGTLVKIGTGFEILSGNNTLTGGVVVNGGTLALTGDNSAAAGGMYVNNGGTLHVQSSNSLLGDPMSNKVALANGGALTAFSGTANPAQIPFGTISSLLSRIDPNSTGIVALQTDGSVQAPITENLNFSSAGPNGALNVSLGAVLTATPNLGNAPVVYTGVITPNANTFRLGGGGGRLILPNGATLAGSNGLNIGGGGGGGFLFLTGAYTFTGPTLINSGTTIVTNLTDGGVAGSLGAASADASNLVLNGGTLQYVGNGSSTNRLFTLSTTPTALDSSGTAPLNFTNTGPMAFLNSGNRTLTLQGNNTGLNTIAAAIGDAVGVAGAANVPGNGVTSITKNGNGTWVLSGNNTFSNGVTVNNGVLLFTGPNSVGANSVNGPATVLVNAGGAAALGSGFTGSLQAGLNRISPLSTGAVALTANTSENLNLDGGSAGANLPTASLGAYGNVSYTGNLTPFGNVYRLGGGGGVLTMPNGGLTGPRSVQIAGGGPGANFVNNPNLNGAVVLGGTSDYTGGTVLLGGGVLSATSNAALGSGPLKFQGGMYRVANNGDDITLASDGVAAREIRIGNESSGNNQTANVDVPTGIATSFSKVFSTSPVFGANLGTESFTKFGGGSLVLAGGVGYNGTTIIERGTLGIGANPMFYGGNVQVGSNNGGVGTLKLVANNVFASGPQFGAGNVVDIFNGSKIDVNGMTDTLRLVRGYGGIVNTSATPGNLTVGTINELEILGGNLAGNFNLTVAGTVTNLFGTGATINSLELWNNNNPNFTGKLAATAGGIRLRADGTLGSTADPLVADKITLNNSAVLLAAGGNPLVLGANRGITLASGGGTLWAFNSSAMIVNGPVSGPGRLTIADDTGSVLLASDNNTYAGGTQINSNTAGRGQLVIGAGGSTGSLPAGDVFFNSGAGLARLFFFKSSDMTVSNTFNGPGQIFQVGGGTTTLNGINNTNQTTFVGGGRLRADFSAPGSNPISTGTNLQIGSGAFEYVGPSGDNALRLGSLVATAPATMGTNVIVGGVIGDAVVQSTYGGSGVQELIFNGNTRGTAGVTVNFMPSGGVNGTTNKIEFTTGVSTNNVIGAAYFFNGSEFAAYDSTGYVRAASHGVDANTAAVNALTGGRYLKLTSAITNTANLSVPGINLSGPTAAFNLNGTTLTINGNPGTILKSGGGSSTLDVGTINNNGQELIVRTDTAADSLTIGATISGTGLLAKSGLGTLVLNNVNTYTGNTLVNSGILMLTGNGQIGTLNAANGSELRVALTAGQTAAVIMDSPNASFSSGQTNNGFRIGELGNGIFNQSDGTVNSAVFTVLGEAVGSTGTYTLSGGTFNVRTSTNLPTAGSAPSLVVGRAGTGTLNVSGDGVLNVKNGAAILLGAGTFNTPGFQTVAPNAGISTGVGTVNQSGGTVNIETSAGVYQGNLFGGVVIGVDGTGTYNLNGGTLNTPILARGNGTATFNLGGGTLRATAPTLNADLPINLTGTGAGRGVIDTNGNDITFTSKLAGPGGFTKVGAGTLSAIGNGSNYAGGTDITAGNVLAGGTGLGTGPVTVGDNGTLTVQGAQQGLLARFYLATSTTATAPGTTAGSATFAPELASLDNFNAWLDGKAAVATEATTARGKVSVNYLEGGGANQTTALPPALIAAQNGSLPFAARLTGKFNAPTAGDYTFQTRGDDGTVLWIDGQPVLDNNRFQGVTTRTGTTALTAGAHDIVIGFYQGTGGAAFDVGVTLPGQGQSFITGSELNMSNALLSHGDDLTVGSVAGTGALNLRSGTLFTGSDNSTTTFSGPITGAGGSLVKQGTGTMTISNTGNNFTGTTGVTNGTLNVTGSINGSAINVSGGTLLLGASQKVRSVTITGGTAQLVSGALKVLTVGDGTETFSTVSVTGGKLDLTTNGMVVDYAPGGETTVLQSIRGQIIAGYNGGDWQGNGITSSTAAADGTKAVGYAQASEVAPGGVFLGVPVDATAVVVRYTIYGDATLDGKVDFNDLVKLAQNYNIVDGTRLWSSGDFTYDGNTDFNDLVKLAQNYNTALPAEPVPGASVNFNADLAAAFAAVPEPGSLSVLALAGLALLRRRNRRAA
jgi:autotransporter-associated beta strand protein